MGGTQGRIKVIAGPGQLAFWGPLDKQKLNVKRRRRRNFSGKWPDSKIFVKWQPRKCSENGAAGEIFNTSKKIYKRSSNPGPPRAGPRAAAPQPLG
jgi:hypothetical protein